MAAEDIEKKNTPAPAEKQDISVIPGDEASDFYDPNRESLMTRLGLNVESFKRAPGASRGQISHGNVPVEHQGSHDNTMLQQQLKHRHIQMIAVGGAIGTGLFVGSGLSLSTGGPASVIIGWLLMGIMMINVTQALGEMAIVYPVSGGFYTLAGRFLDPAFAFAIGLNYAFQWAVTLPLEIGVAASTVEYWDGASKVPLAGWITIFIVIVLIGTLFGARGYGEIEFWSSCLRLLMVTVFLIAGVVCICGGGPKSGAFGEYVGGRYWHDPGAFNNGFKGFCSVFVTAAFTFSGAELCGVAATETPNPRETMPSAVKNTFWRISFIYIFSAIIFGLGVPFNDPLLTEGVGANGSPFVIMMRRANIKGLDDFVNATVLVSVLSIAMASVYGASRFLTAMAENGYAPKIFAYVDKAGRPLYSLAVVVLFAPIAYVNCAPEAGTTVFNWLIAIAGLSILFTWMSICITHIRFRRAWAYHGHSVEELPFTALGGVYGSYMGCTFIILVLIGQFWIAIWPIGGMLEPKAEAENFFMIWVSLPIFLLMWLVGFIWKRTTPRRLPDIDLDTGRKSWLTAEEMNEWRRQRRLAPWYVRIYRALFTY